MWQVCAIFGNFGRLRYLIDYFGQFGVICRTEGNVEKFCAISAMFGNFAQI